MALETLPINPSDAINLSETPDVHVIKFGDSYEQRIETGINTVKQQWQVTYRRKAAKAHHLDADKMINTVLSFFRARKAVEAFWWTPPGEAAAKKFVARRWALGYDEGVAYQQGVTLPATLTAVLEEVFE